MARKEKSNEPEGMPAWLVTFSDLMTLLLTFFVLLLSMAVIDERNKLEVLGSVAKQFGEGELLRNPTGAQGKRLSVQEPGHIDDLPPDDLEPLRDRIFDDASKDLNFQENKYVQIFSINDEVLFGPGGSRLTEKGIALLDRILPYLQNIPYPLLVAGHTASRREEEGKWYKVEMTDPTVDSTWPLSMNRALSVYQHLIARGIPANRLSLEAFGSYKPRGNNNTPAGRRKNRRVDLVLDKRNMEWIQKVEALRGTLPPQKTEHFYKGFKFDLNMPGSTNSPAGF